LAHKLKGECAIIRGREEHEEETNQVVQKEEFRIEDEAILLGFLKQVRKREK